MFCSKWKGAKTPIMLTKNVDFSCREQPKSREETQHLTQNRIALLCVKVEVYLVTATTKIKIQ